MTDLTSTKRVSLVQVYGVVYNQFLSGGITMFVTYGVKHLKLWLSAVDEVCDCSKLSLQAPAVAVRAHMNLCHETTVIF